MSRKNDTSVNKIGTKLKSMRKKKNLAINELSDLTGINESQLKKIEDGKHLAPVGDLLKIARALTIDPGELLMPEKERLKELESKRILDFKRREEAYQYEVLTPRATKNHLRAFKVFIPPRSEHPHVHYQHDGEEFVFTLKGEVDIQVGHKNYHLEKGETLHFNSGIRHSLKNQGNGTTVLIVTIYTP